MRPKSIVLFERIVLASIGLGILSLLMSLELLEMVARITGAGMGILIGIPLLIFMIYGVLVYFVARKGSNAARWIYVVLAGLGLLWGLANLGTLTSMPAYILLLTLAQHALTAASLFMLFQADANAWFAQGAAGAAYGNAPGGWPNQAPPGAGAWPSVPAPAPGSWPPQAPQQAGGWPPHAAATPPVQAPVSTWPPAAPAAPSWPPAAEPAPAPLVPQPAPAAPAPAAPPAPDAAAAGATHRKCPFCAEEIRVEAVKCRYCGSQVEPEGQR